MKKSKFLMFAAIACSSFFIASCSNDIESNGNGTQGDNVSLDVQVVDENPDTRLYLGTDKYNHFSTGDKVGVWSVASAPKVEMTCTEEGTLSKLNGQIGQANGFFAGYPYDAVVGTSSSYGLCATVAFTDNQTYTDTEIKEDKNKFVPILVGGTDGFGTHIKLYNACAIIKVTFVNNSSNTINSVRLNTNSAACITNVTNKWGVSYNNQQINGIALNAVGTEAYGSPLQYRVKKLSIASGKSETIYFILPIQSSTHNSIKYSVSAFTSDDGTGDAVITKTLKTALSVARNKIYNLGTIKIPYDPATYAYPYYYWDDFTPLSVSTPSNYKSSGDPEAGYKNNWGLNNVLTGDQAMNIAALKIVSEYGMKVEAYYVTDAGPTTTVEIPTSVIPTTAYLTSNFNWANFTINRGTTTSTITTKAGFYVRMSKSGNTMGTQAQWQNLADKTGFVFFPAYGRVMYLLNTGLGANGFILRDFGSEAMLWTSTPSVTSPTKPVVLRLAAENINCYTQQYGGPNVYFMAPATY